MWASAHDNNCMSPGTHFPLCIKLGGLGRRSYKKQLERTKGTKEFKAKQDRKEYVYCDFYTSKKEPVRRGIFGVGPMQKRPPTGQGGDSQNWAGCKYCNSFDHTSETCPKLRYGNFTPLLARQDLALIDPIQRIPHQRRKDRMPRLEPEGEQHIEAARSLIQRMLLPGSHPRLPDQ